MTQREKRKGAEQKKKKTKGKKKKQTKKKKEAVKRGLKTTTTVWETNVHKEDEVHL